MNEYDLFESAISARYPGKKYRKIPVLIIGSQGQNYPLSGLPGDLLFIGHLQTSSNGLNAYLDGKIVGGWATVTGLSPVMCFNQLSCTSNTYNNYTWLFLGYMYKFEEDLFSYKPAPADFAMTYE